MAKEMKDSGIEWIGEIPEEWKMVRVKNEYCFHKDIVGDRADDYQRLALTLNGVIKRSKEDSTGLQPEKFTGYQILNQGELVFKLIDLENVSTSRVGYSSYVGLVSPAYIILTPREKVNSKFGEYYFLSMWQREVFNHMGDDGVRSSLNSNDLLNVPYIRMSYEEQTNIARFLDAQCAELKNIIDKTHASIDEYKKLKQAIITQAVTKGVRGERKMTDSGNDFIGMMPCDWEVCKFGKCVTIKSNLVAPEDYLSYPQIAPDNIEKGSARLLNNIKTVEEVGVVSWNHLFHKGQIIYSKIRPTLNKLVIAPFDGLCSADMYPIETENNAEFIVFLMLSDLFLSQVGLVTMNRVKMPKINQNELANIRVPLPKPKEQGEIAEYLKCKCMQLDEIIDKKEEYLSEVEKYKKSLIYEYVTGKKEVPETWA